MLLWRISRFRDLGGLGGLYLNGRWHHLGHPVVYFSESPAAALLEICVHTAADDIPPDFTLLRVEGPDVDTLSVSGDDLPQNWVSDLDWTRDRGTAWLRGAGSLLLRVPSAIIPHTNNLLFNPAHPDARLFRVIEALTYPFDPRLKQ